MRSRSRLHFIDLNRIFWAFFLLEYKYMYMLGEKTSMSFVFSATDSDDYLEWKFSLR